MKRLPILAVILLLLTMALMPLVSPSVQAVNYVIFDENFESDTTIGSSSGWTLTDYPSTTTAGLVGHAVSSPTGVAPNWSGRYLSLNYSSVAVKTLNVTPEAGSTFYLDFMLYKPSYNENFGLIYFTAASGTPLILFISYGAIKEETTHLAAGIDTGLSLTNGLWTEISIALNSTGYAIAVKPYGGSWSSTYSGTHSLSYLTLGLFGVGGRDKSEPIKPLPPFPILIGEVAGGIFHD